MNDRVNYYKYQDEAEWKISFEWPKFEIDVDTETDLHTIWEYLNNNTKYRVGILKSQEYGEDRLFRIYFEAETERDSFELYSKLSEWHQRDEEPEESTVHVAWTWRTC